MNRLRKARSWYCKRRGHKLQPFTPKAPDAKWCSRCQYIIWQQPADTEHALQIAREAMMTLDGPWYRT